MDHNTSNTINLAVISDFHVSEPEHPEAEVRSQRLRAAVTAVNASGADLVLVPGDLTENGHPGELNMLRQCLDYLDPPVRFVPGNHDVGDKHFGSHRGVTSERIAAYRSLIGPDVLSEHVGGVHLIGLNGPALGSDLEEEKTNWRLLEDALQETLSDPRVILLHYPPFVESPHEPGGDYWALEFEPRKRLLDMAEAGHVSIILSGHLHRPLWTSYRGIRLATAPSVAFGLPIGVQPTGWMQLAITPDGQISRCLHYVSDAPTVSGP